MRWPTITLVALALVMTAIACEEEQEATPTASPAATAEASPAGPGEATPDLTATAVTTPTVEPAPQDTPTLAPSLSGRILFVSDRDGNGEICDLLRDVFDEYEVPSIL